MWPLYISALLIHSAISITPYKDSVEIVSHETKNPQDLIGSWTLVFHWTDDPKKGVGEFDRTNDQMFCPVATISLINPNFVKAREEACAGFSVPFNWSDAKLQVDMPQANIQGIIFFGEKDTWVFNSNNCGTVYQVVFRMVPGGYFVMTDPEMTHSAELMARKTRPTVDELRYIVHNVDVGKRITTGFGLCYQA